MSAERGAFPHRSSGLLKTWMVVRLPLAVGVVFIFRNELMNLTERLFGVAKPTVFAIEVLSTTTGRGLILVPLVLCAAATLALLPGRVALPSMLSFGIFLGLYLLTRTPHALVLSAGLASVAALNLTPGKWWLETARSPAAGRLLDTLFLLGVGVSELLLLRPLTTWYSLRVGREGDSRAMTARRIATGIAYAVIVPALAVLFVNAEPIRALETRLYEDPAVLHFAKGDLNGLALSPERKLLYVTGHGTEEVLAFDLADLTRPPLRSAVGSGRAQAVAFNRAADELYVHHRKRGRLLVLSADTLELKESIETPALAPGDSWVVWDRQTGQVIICSEADRPGEISLLAVERRTGHVTASADIDAGSLMLHPRRPLLYMSFFRRTSDLLAYDLASHRIVRRQETHPRLDRMAYWEGGNEVLVVSPLHSAVLRHDAETLEPKGTLRTLFGVRTLAVDENRNLLLVGSLVNNKIAVIDLESGRQLAEFRVGPWLRSIVLDASAGVAYVSSRYGVYRVDYAGALDEQG